jgi:CBS domain-containing protein
MPNDWPKGMDERLARLVKELESGSSPERVTVRTLLGWFDSQRRGSWIVPYIKGRLAEFGLETQPDFTVVYIDAKVAITLKKTAPKLAPGQPVSVASDSDPTFSDPTYRIGNIASANKPVVSINPDASRAEAITLMMQHDFSQLPVMQNERDVKGMLSWASIGKKLALNKSWSCARECMETHFEIGADKSLFSAVDGIIRNEYVLVRSADQKISGIVTTADLSREFLTLAEPFLLLGEIENHLRVLIESAFSQDELIAIRDPVDAARSVSSASDLAFGEYIRLLENVERWSKLGLELDRKTFVEGLIQIKDTRNDVMHFSPDPLEESAMGFLKSFHKMLRELVELRTSTVTPK